MDRELTPEGLHKTNFQGLSILCVLLFKLSLIRLRKTKTDTKKREEVYDFMHHNFMITLLTLNYD